MSDKLNIDYLIAAIVGLGVVSALGLMANGLAVPEWLSAEIIGGGFAALIRAAK